MGSEEEAGTATKVRYLDYLVATPFPVPERFHTTVME